MSVAGMLGLVAAIAINIWLFRQGALWGILGLNVSKHVLIAYFCQAAGVNRRAGSSGSAASSDPVLGRSDNILRLN